MIKAWRCVGSIASAAIFQGDSSAQRSSVVAMDSIIAGVHETDGCCIRSAAMR